MPFTLVQQKAFADTGAGVDPTIVLDAGATSGNLIVVALGHRRSDASATPVISGAGSTGLTREYAYTDNTGGNKGVALFWKVASGGETTFTTTEVQQWRYIAVAEFALPSGATGATWHNHATATANTAASSLTVGVPDPAADSMAWASFFARDSSGSPPSFDSGFAAASAAQDFAVTWRDDAEGVSGNNVTGTYGTTRIAIAGSGVWTADGVAQLSAPTGFAFTANGTDLSGSWDTVTDADTYDWEIEEDVAGTWTAFDSGSTASTAFEVTAGVTLSTSYRARVRAASTTLTDSPWTSWASLTTVDALAARRVRWSGGWETSDTPRRVRWDGSWQVPV